MPDPGRSSLEGALRRDRRVVVASLVLVAASAWAYMLAGAGLDMDAPVTTPEWTLTHTAVVLAMWWVMMIAMMLPSAAPVILLATALNRRSHAAAQPFGAAGFFTAGYLAAWLLFSLAAAAAQWMLAGSGVLSHSMDSASTALSAGLLIGAGLWQLTPVKQACLRHCRSPVQFLTRHRRPGNAGAVAMGMVHGSYCLGCCWFLMALLFVGGVMNLYWIAGLALIVLAEKSLPRGYWFSRATGAALVAAGVVVAVW